MKITDLKQILKSFSFRDTKASETQKSAQDTESFVEQSVKAIYGDGATIIHLGSQEHPDFFVLGTEAFNELLEYAKYKRNTEGTILVYKTGPKKGTPKINSKKITKKDILKWANSVHNSTGIQPVWVSVKSTRSGLYRTNDNTPGLSGESNETVYVNFNYKKQTISICLSSDIAEGFQISDKIREEERKANEAYKQLLREVRKIPAIAAATCLRATAIKSQYMDFDSENKKLERVFQEAGVR